MILLVRNLSMHQDRGTGSNALQNDSDMLAGLTEE